MRLATVATLAFAAGCASTTAHAPSVSTCGGIYRVRLPGGRRLSLGGCSGTLHADSAPRVTVQVGDEISVWSVRDAQGAPVEKPPVLARQGALRVVGRDPARGVLLLQAGAAGISVLVAHTPLCTSPLGEPALSCPVLRVTVTP